MKVAGNIQEMELNHEVDVGFPLIC